MNYLKFAAKYLVLIIIFALPYPAFAAQNNRICDVEKVPVDQPNMDRAAIAVWANTAIVKAYSYDFVNNQHQLKQASSYFTPDGWTHFTRAITAVHLLKTIKKEHLVVSGVARRSPVVIPEGLLDERFTWRVKMPILVTYASPTGTTQQILDISILIQRTQPPLGQRGLGIQQFVAVLSKTQPIKAAVVKPEATKPEQGKDSTTPTQQQNQ